MDRFLSLAPPRDGNGVDGNGLCGVKVSVERPVEPNVSNAGREEAAKDQPTPAKRARSDSMAQSGQKNNTKGTDDWNVTGWLNSLTAREALAIETDLVSNFCVVEQPRFVTGGPVAVLLALSNPSSPGRDGEWYGNQFARCKVPVERTKQIKNLPAVTATGGSSSAGSNAPTREQHGRYQVKINAAGGGSVRSVIHSALRRVAGYERAISLMADFSRCASDPSKAHAAVKIWRHHLACIAHLPPGTLIPTDCGAGGSVSHLCDTTSCIRGDHLRPESAHIDNMARQRCRGVVLTIMSQSGEILQETPCEHGQEAARLVSPGTATNVSVDDELRLSCRKVWLIDLGATRAQVNHIREVCERSLRVAEGGYASGP